MIVNPQGRRNWGVIHPILKSPTSQLMGCLISLTLQESISSSASYIYFFLFIFFYFLMNQSDRTVGRALALPVSNLGLIPGFTYDLLSNARDGPKNPKTKKPKSKLSKYDLLERKESVFIFVAPREIIDCSLLILLHILCGGGTPYYCIFYEKNLFLI